MNKNARSHQPNQRAAIVTFQSAYNYGAVLQAYALQEYLNENFCDTCVLNYHCAMIDKTYARPSVSDFARNPKKSVFLLLQSVLYRKKNAKIDQFRHEHLKLTKRYYLSNIQDANSEAQVFITGSDQVWNRSLIGDDTTFFLDFVTPEKRTCSYAASIGLSSIPDEFVEQYKKAISHVQKVSVRETEGLQTLRDIGISCAEVMPDPTLLLPKDRWESLLIKPKSKGKYILVYKITRADRLLAFAKDLSKKTGLPIIYVPNNLESGVVGKTKLDVGPTEWLGYIYNAEYVVTNSFHGTVFSILFGKKFFLEVSRKVNWAPGRLLTLLSLFGLEDRTMDRFADRMLEEQLPLDHIEKICAEQRNRVHDYFEEVFIKEGLPCQR